MVEGGAAVERRHRIGWAGGGLDFGDACGDGSLLCVLEAPCTRTKTRLSISEASLSYLFGLRTQTYRAKFCMTRRQWQWHEAPQRMICT